ncbi:MAG: PAQR family membrane homeostasis protein TrhA [Pseudomonadota bacterium]
MTAPADREHLADTVVHVVGLVLGVIGAVALVTVAVAGADRHHRFTAIAVYLFGLIAMLSCSALYNVWRSCGRREWLRRFDHAAIFVMIAGTYTPIALRLPAPWDWALTGGVWSAAAAGVVIKLLRPRGLEAVSIALYLALGWIGLVAIDPLVATIDADVLLLVLLGGAVYSGGVIIHRADRRYARALWHACVLAAAAIHYAAIMSLTVA